MDIDCDGALEDGDGSCDSSNDTQGQTTFQADIEGYGKGIKDLNAYVHSYVVLGNDGSKRDYIIFKPEQYGVEPLSIVAVVCGNKMVCCVAPFCSVKLLLTLSQFYGVWGDTNGDDGPPLVGEVSDSLGKACYGDSVNGNQAHDENDILYIGFTGADAVPGASGAQWDADSFDSFESFLGPLGDRLLQRIGDGNNGGGRSPGNWGNSPSCS